MISYTKLNITEKYKHINLRWRREVMLDRHRWWQRDRGWEHSTLIWIMVMKPDLHTHRHNDHTHTGTTHTLTREGTSRRGPCTCTVVVLSVPVTLVLQVCGSHRRTYGPGCFCCLAVVQQNRRDTWVGMHKVKNMSYLVFVPSFCDCLKWFEIDSVSKISLSSYCPAANIYMREEFIAELILSPGFGLSGCKQFALNDCLTLLQLSKTETRIQSFSASFQVRKSCI